MVASTSVSPARQLLTHLPSTNLVPAAHLAKQVPLTREPLGQGGVQVGLLEERLNVWPVEHLPVGGGGWAVGVGGWRLREVCKETTSEGRHALGACGRQQAAWGDAH